MYTNKISSVVLAVFLCLSGLTLALEEDQYEPDNTFSQAKIIHRGISQTHSIIPTSDVDWIKFDLIRTSDIMIRTSGLTGDTRLWLYDSSMTQIAYNDDGGSGYFSSINETGLPPGTYYAKVDEYGNNSEISSYSILLTASIDAISYNTLYTHDSSSNLYTLNSSTGAATLLGSIGIYNVTDIAFDKSKLYGITFSGFLLIDPISGNGNLIGNLGFSSMNALAVASSGKVYSASSTTGDFISIDPSTGTGTLIGNYGTGLTSSGDLAFSLDGNLYASLIRSGYTNDWLATIDLNTGQATLIGDIGHDEVFGLSFKDGILYGLTSLGKLLQIDTFSGSSTLVGESGLVQWGMSTSPAITSPAITPFLSFPLKGQTPYKAAITSVFDHSMSYSFEDNNEVVAYTGEIGEKKYGVDWVFGTHFGFKQEDNSRFHVNGNYTGGGNPYYLYYDGHPAIDYSTGGQHLSIYAAASGTAYHGNLNLGEIRVDHGNGYTTHYLHLLVDNNLIANNTPVTTSTRLGLAGGTGGFPVHLHFEVRSDDIPVDPYGWKGTGVDPYKRATNVELWKKSGCFPYTPKGKMLMICW